MSQNPTVQATDPDRIEAVWKEVFQAYGVDERRAQHFVELTFGTPRLTAAAPDVTEIHDIVDDALENVDFESYIDQEYTPAEVRATLLYELDRALAGEYVGPASAPREVILSEQTIGLSPDSRVDERDPSEDVATVESEWREILTDAGVDERRAQHIVELVFGTPELTAAAPDIEEIPGIVADALEDVTIEEYLDGTPINEVRHDLLMALADALAGKYSGPASAPRAIALSEETLSSQRAAELVKEELGIGPDPTPDPTPARLANPMASQPSSSTVRERELDRVIDEMGGDPETVGDPEAFLAEAIAFGDGDRRHAVLQAFRSKLDEETVSWRTFRETIAAAVDRSSSSREETDEDEEIDELVEQFGRIVDESHYELGHLRAAIDRLEASKRGDER
jgi:hypothetical protein